MDLQKIKIGVIGAGKTGQHLIKQLAAFDFINIVMVADIDSLAPGFTFAKDCGIPVTTDYLDIARLGRDVDIIIEVTGHKEIKLGLRSFMQNNENKHTVIVSELVAILLMSMAKGELVESIHGFQRYE